MAFFTTPCIHTLGLQSAMVVKQALPMDPVLWCAGATSRRCTYNGAFAMPIVADGHMPFLRCSSVSEAMEDAVLFMVRYLQEVQGPKHVVGRDFAYIAATPEARRLFLSTARHLMLQVEGMEGSDHEHSQRRRLYICISRSAVNLTNNCMLQLAFNLLLTCCRHAAALQLQLIRSGDTYLSVTNFHDLLSLMCPDFQLRVVKSAFKAAWVVLKGQLLNANFAVCPAPIHYAVGSHVYCCAAGACYVAPYASLQTWKLCLRLTSMTPLQTGRAPRRSRSCRSRSSGSAWS